MKKGGAFGVVFIFGFFLVIYTVGLAPVVSDVGINAVNDLGLTGIESFIILNLNYLIILITLMSAVLFTYVT